MSDENENLENMYKSYIGDPNSTRAESLFHTSYIDKSNEFRNNNTKKRRKH